MVAAVVRKSVLGPSVGAKDAHRACLLTYQHVLEIDGDVGVRGDVEVVAVGVDRHPSSKI